MNAANHRLAWVLGLVGAAALVWLLAGPRPPAREGPGREPAPPLGVQRLEPAVGAPDEAKLEEVLESVEQAESERYGAEEARLRRERRERIIPQRLHDR